MSITREFSNSRNITERTLREQAAADRRLFEQMRQADDEKFHGRADWYPSQAWIDEDSRLRHEEFLDGEWIRRGQW